jgi:hypothetical protein
VKKQIIVGIGIIARVALYAAIWADRNFDFLG